MSDKAGRVVFIGNIPYGLTEEQIVQLCSSVGQVLSFRLVYDQDTGRPKGFGFAEFADTDAAASAVRNLDKHQIQGRELRVDFSHVGGKDDAAPANYQPQPQVQQPPPAAAAVPVNNSIGPLPPGTELPAGMTCADSISKTLSTLPTPQLLDILSQMKGLVAGDPGRANELLSRAPQLSYAIFQALLLMGLVDSTMIASVVEQAATAGPNPAGVPMPVPMSMAQRPAAALHHQAGSFAAGGGAVNTPPPLVHTPYQAPPPPPSQLPAQQQQGQQQQQQPPAIQPGHEQLLKQVLDMPQAEVDKLQPAERAQIMALKQQFGGRIGY